MLNIFQTCRSYQKGVKKSRYSICRTLCRRSISNYCIRIIVKYLAEYHETDIFRFSSVSCALSTFFEMYESEKKIERTLFWDVSESFADTAKYCPIIFILIISDASITLVGFEWCRRLHFDRLSQEGRNSQRNEIFPTHVNYLILH